MDLTEFLEKMQIASGRLLPMSWGIIILEITRNSILSLEWL